jgi:putative ABC transport system permease protein
VVLARNILERRGELALLRALGWRFRDVRRLVLAETAALLGMGLAIGVAATLIAVSPHLWQRFASVPWLGMLALLAGVAGLGLGSAWLALRFALRVPLLPALRRE